MLFRHNKQCNISIRHAEIKNNIIDAQGILREYSVHLLFYRG